MKLRSIFFFLNIIAVESLWFQRLLAGTWGGQLKAVCTFGKPASPTLCKGICGENYAHNVYELNRLCRTDDLTEPLSAFVSACLRRLRADNGLLYLLAIRQWIIMATFIRLAILCTQDARKSALISMYQTVSIQDITKKPTKANIAKYGQQSTDIYIFVRIARN